MRYASLVIAIFAARFFTTAITYPQSDGDIAWQRWLGSVILTTKNIPRHLGTETFSAIGAPWVPQEWLFSLIAFSSNGIWWWLFAGFVAMCPLIALIVIALRAQKSGASNTAIAIVIALAGIAMLESFGIRVQVVAWPLLALYLYFIEQEDKKAWYAVAIAAVWGNIHASVMLAPALAGCIALGSYLDEGLNKKTKRLAYISIGTLVATCLNPFGWGLPIYAVHLFSSPFKELISEWRHTSIGETSFIAGALPLILLLATCGIHGKAKWQDRILVIATSILMFSAARNIAIFAISAASICALSITTLPLLREKEVTDEKADKLAKKIMPIFAGILFVVVTIGIVVNPERTDTGEPDKAIAFIKAQPGEHKIFCADFAWCAFFVGEPNNRVYLDSRADPYPQKIWDTYTKIVRVKPGWEKTLEGTHANIVMTNDGSSLDAVMELSKEWKTIYRDKKYEVWRLKTEKI